LIRKEFKQIDSGSILLPDEFMIRHGIRGDRLLSILKSFKDLKICVIGDLIVDEYITCQPLGISQEDPAIVVTPLDSSKFLGGAGIVAAHGVGLGAAVEFFSVVGADEAGEYSLRELKSSGVEACIFIDEGRPTTLKQRYRSNGKSLFRVSHLHQNSISIELQEKMLTALKKSLPNSDVLIFSDFNYGCLPQRIVDQVIEIAKNSNVLIAADSQSSSQIGDVCRFKGLDLITPTEREARVAARNREDGLVILAEKVQKLSGAKIVFLKLGAEGLLIHRDPDEKDSLITDKIGALNCAPKDVAGAGDSMLITSALTLAKGGTVWEAAVLGSLAASVQVSRVGNTPLHLDDLVKELKL
jgi:rfaE bifunctional protein kinase chain/domain